MFSKKVKPAKTHSKVDIIKHITEGLYSNQEVVISGFGKFIGERKASYIEDGTIYPPTKKVSFVRDTKIHALDLAIYIAKRERVTEDDAAIAISAFVKEANQKLEAGQSVVFEGIGIIAPKPDGTFHFHQSQHANLLPETFGMTPIELKKNNLAAGESASSGKKSSLAWLWWLLGSAAIVLIAVGVWWFFLRDYKFKHRTAEKADTLISVVDTSQHLADTMLGTTDTTNNDIVEPPVNGAMAKISPSENANEAFETHFKKKKVIYLVVGSFKEKENATNLKKALLAEGFQSQILSSGNGFLRVTIGHFPNKQETMKVYNSFIAKHPKKDIWAL